MNRPECGTCAEHCPLGALLGIELQISAGAETTEMSRLQRLRGFLRGHVIQRAARTVGHRLQAMSCSAASVEDTPLWHQHDHCIAGAHEIAAGLAPIDIKLSEASIDTLGRAGLGPDLVPSNEPPAIANPLPPTGDGQAPYAPRTIW